MKRKKMSKTMIDNRLYNDEWFFNLPSEAKLLFLFLITNESCNLIGCYEMPCRAISLYTGIPIKNLVKDFNYLSNRVSLKNGWVIIKNYSKYNPMRNPSINLAKEKQESLLPDEIKEIYTGCLQGVNTLPTPQQETETEKESISIKGGMGGRDLITNEVILEVASKYSVPESFVRSKFEDVCNWEDEKPGRMRGRNWKLTLMAWVKKDAIKLKGGQHGRRISIAPIPE
jgi:hypothetical protein